MSKTRVYATRPQTYRQELLRVSDADLECLQEMKTASKNMIKESIQILRDWYNKQPHFPAADLEDFVLLRQLCANKFSLEKTKDKMENLLTARTMVPDFFSIRDPMHPKILEAFDVFEWVIFPQPTPEKYRIIYTRMKPNASVQNFDPNMMYTISMMLGDIRDAVDAVSGDIHIWDNINSVFGHITKVTPAHVKNSSVVMQQCYGHRIKGIHIVNIPPFAEFIYNLTKSCLPKKVASRFYLHTRFEDLYEYIPKAIFPKDMGGDEPKTSSEIAETWKTALQSPEWRQWFLDTKEFKTNESRRPKNTSNIISEEFGVCGSFRKLDFD